MGKGYNDRSSTSWQADTQTGEHGGHSYFQCLRNASICAAGDWTIYVSGPSEDRRNGRQTRTGGPDAVEYRFWPTWQKREPDVELHIQSNEGVSYLVGIEAKYHSGKSSEAEDVEQETEEEISHECTDQLVCEWNELVDEAAIRNAKPILIYLTADFGCPREQIRDSLVEYRKKRLNSPEPLICWLSWRELADLFANATKHSILLAIADMTKEMGLTFFRGITEVAPICNSWKFKAPPHKWQFQLLPVVFQWSFQTSRVLVSSRTWRFHVEPIISQWMFQQMASEWSFRAAPIVCQWRFQEPTAAWHFHTAPIVSRWRFKR